VRTPILPLAILLLPLALAGCAKPSLDLPTPINTIGQSTPITVQVHAPHGLAKLTATLGQNNTQYPAWQLTTSKTTDTTIHFDLALKTTPQLHDGPAKLILEATSAGLFPGKTRIERDVTIVTQPPVLTADSDQHYLYLGMADLATLNVTGPYTATGIRVGDQTFRAWPMPTGNGEAKPGLFSLYAFAWNMTPGTIPVAFASNGTEVTTPLTVIFPKREQPVYKQDNIQVTDQFLQKVITELDPTGSGDPIARFVKVNTGMRKANNKTLSDLQTKTADHFLFTQPFARQPAKSEATFADDRTYLYHGQKIDRQVHLGYDLAGTQHMGVQASNDGVVVYAAPLGIYGNCIVVDHGYGLHTIYGHLSRIDVKVGDPVKRGQPMGLSGMTGMAGGDHIHFAMQLDGIQIDPKEWWDPHWIKDHITRRIDLPTINK
jgi:murein DD-endopeptidase MepM/ murein hydrolase activator NlpD